MMSTSIYKPLELSFLTKTEDRMPFCRPEVRKVKRILFGPADHIATQKFIDDELKKITITESERWNFDFRNEKTLNPKGAYKWRPATPPKTIRPIKRRPSFDEFETEELYAQPTEIIRPIPLRINQEDQEMNTRTKTIPKSQSQRLITDFMLVKKSKSSKLMKKNDWPSSVGRPSKVPRLSELSS